MRREALVMMAKIRRYFFWTWTAATLILALFGYVQTRRLENASAELRHVRVSTVASLLGQSQGLLSAAAEEVDQRNLGTAQADASAALDLLKAAAANVKDDSAAKLGKTAEAIRKVRGDVLAGDENRTASGDLLRLSSEVRQAASGK